MSVSREERDELLVGDAVGEVDGREVLLDRAEELLAVGGRAAGEEHARAGFGARTGAK